EELVVVAAPDLGPAIAGHRQVHGRPDLAVLLRQDPAEVERIAHAIGIARAVGKRIALTRDQSVDEAAAGGRIYDLRQSLLGHRRSWFGSRLKEPPHRRPGAGGSV